MGYPWLISQNTHKIQHLGNLFYLKIDYILIYILYFLDQVEAEPIATGVPQQAQAQAKPIATGVPQQAQAEPTGY